MRAAGDGGMKSHPTQDAGLARLDRRQPGGAAPRARLAPRSPRDIWGAKKTGAGR